LYEKTFANGQNPNKNISIQSEFTTVSKNLNFLGVFIASKKEKTADLL